MHWGDIVGSEDDAKTFASKVKCAKILKSGESLEYPPKMS